MRRVSALTWLLCLGITAEAVGQPGSVETADPASVPTEVAIVLRPTPELRELADDVADTLARRTGMRVAVGDRPPPEVLEAVPRGHLGLAVEDDGRVALALGGPGGVAVTTRLELGEEVARSARARAISLAAETLVDAASLAERPPVPAADPPVSPAAPPRRTVPPVARPTLYLRLMLGVSPLRRQLLVGPGAGLGLCVRSGCAVFEADLPLLRDSVVSADNQRIRYRAVNTALRAQVRPFELGDFVPGFGLGILTRIGTASVPGTELRRTVTNFGVRTSAELAWRFREPFEIVIEAGVDVAVSRARFVHYPAATFLEDRYTPWAVTSIRMRPALEEE